MAGLETPDMKALVQYLRADLERTNEYLNSLSAFDLDRELDEPEFQSLPTVGVRLLVSWMTLCSTPVSRPTCKAC
ncbi:MAG: hypothetical protein QF713_04695 [Dehalococcoidales bacterium]|nr:hypothetical protein [Dehalococcoidales bacterium]MDP7525614.1 hypothetical protein [Dehalococcoidales bacterium]